jgi:HEAT repeat protein
MNVSRRHVLSAAALAGPIALASHALRPSLALAEEPPKMSAAFQRFKFSFFEDPKSAQDALDTAALEQLSGDERKQAEDMLIAFLPDSRAVIGLGVLRSRSAEPRLVALFVAERARQAAAKTRRAADWNPLGIVFLARALWLIDPDPQWPPAIADVLSSSKYWMGRQEAADALSGVRDPASVDALIKALDDDEPLVRFSAARALLATYGLPPEPITDPQALIYRVMSDDAARHAAAKREILAAIAGRRLLPP